LLRIFALAAPYVFILGMALSMALILDEILAALAPAGLPDSGRASGILLLLGGFTFIAAFLSWRVNINAFSMHNFYRNRLVRCYIGASDRDREPHPFTGFDMREHRVRLSDMVTDEPDLNDQRIEDADLREPYAGPYHIINAALNLVSGENLAWQHRKATAFIFSPKYTGYEVWEQSKHKKPGWLARAGYRPTRYYPDGISLGTAMAISGAAVSPNMGRFSSPALAFLMTVFNVRLGWWLGNPRHRLAWLKSGPVAGLAYLFFELFGMTNDQRGYVYLSDGGHFENLGIYELVKRRCRYIIACDGGQDREFTFGDLGSAIEKCRTDFGVDIEIDLGSLRKNSKHPYSQWHCAVGKIRYDKLDARFAAGTILYLKSSLTGDEPVDVLRYAEENKEFPHQSTADQWFDESQFESYRALGEHIVKSVFEAVGEHDDIACMTTEEVFVALQKNWFPPSEAIANAFTKHADTLERIFSQIRDDEHLRFLDHQIYPEWQTLLENALDYSEMNLWLPGTYDELRAGFYMSNQMIQLMENVYHDLNLEKEFENPDNRGWMNLFHHFSWSGMFRVAWAISASTYGARFQNFCKRRLKLDVGKVQIGEPRTIAQDPATSNQAIEKLQKDLVINFYETDLLRKLFKNSKDSDELVIYPLQLKVAVPARDDFILFNFGFALTAQQKLQYYRVQDHLRKMGLGRQALHLLIHRHNITDFERLDPLKKDPDAPPAEEIHKFETLFISVKNEIVNK